MKRVLAALGETLLFILTGLVFMFWRPFHVTWQLAPHGNEVRTFQGDWLIGALIAAAIIGVILLLFKRLKSGYPQLLVALVLAVIIGFAMRFGFTSATAQLMF